MSGPNCDKCGVHCGMCLCGQGLPPAPVALTAEMLGEEDRKHLTWLRGNSTDLELLGVMPCQAAIEANQWADRLLNQGEG